MYWKSPKDGNCCECRPHVCDPCDACPTAETIELTVSGVLACCTADNSRLNGLGSINGVHTLTRQESGDYTKDIAGAVSVDWFAEPDCESLFSSDDSLDVTITFSCIAESAILDIRLSDSGVRLFYAEITPPGPGELFVFGGEEECSAITPYTYGVSASVET